MKTAIRRAGRHARPYPALREIGHAVLILAGIAGYALAIVMQAGAR